MRGSALASGLCLKDMTISHEMIINQTILFTTN
jgi:hypothetical protein